MALSFAQAELIGLIFNSCLFGLYAILFIQSLPLAIDEGMHLKCRRFNIVLMASNVLLFASIFSHWVVQIIRSQRAFIDIAGQPPDHANLYYAYPADYLDLLKLALYMFQTIVGDCTMIYRLWIVYCRDIWVVLLPSALVLGFATSCVGVLAVLAKTEPGESIFVSTAGHWAITLFATSVATNILTTGLITLRVWSLRKRFHGVMRDGLMSVAHIIIESAALYTLFAILTMAGYCIKQTWQFVPLDMISPIIGISFTLISVRVNSGYSTEQVRSRGESAPPHTSAIVLDTIPVTLSTMIGDSETDCHSSV